MAKPNLPKLNVDTSVVDYMKSQGMDSSMSARKELAKGLGFTNYSGTESQNIALRNALVNKQTTPVNLSDTGSAPKADKPKVDKPKAETPKAEGLDSVVPASTPTPSAGVSQEVWDAINKPFVASSAYEEAWNLTQGLREKLSSGRTSYTEQIEKLMAQIQGRDKFSYDVSQDTLFQQSLASAMASGKTAMQDTIGQASALTGGYGSTYATSAGNQAYNSYIQDAYANLPEYYQMALEAYQMEGQEMYDQLAMLNTADATEYGRLYDAWNVNNTNAQNLWSQEYGAWQDSINNAFGVGNLQINEQNQAFDQSSTLWEQGFRQTQADLDNEYRDKALLQDQTQFDANLEEEQKQFIARYDINGDGVVNSKDQTTSTSGTADTNKSNTKMPTYKQKALELHKEKGDDAVDAYIDSLGLTEDEKAEIAKYLYGDDETEGYAELPLELRTFKKVDDTKNGFLGVANLWGGIDGNDIVQDQYGNSYKIDELPESIRKSLSKLKKGETYTAK